MAIGIDKSNFLYREKRLSLLLRLNELKKAREEANWIRSQLQKVQKNQNTTSLMWRPRFYLGMFNLLSQNMLAAAQDFDTSLTLAQKFKNFTLSSSVLSLLMYLKTISYHFTSKIQDAMELSVLNAHTNPSSLDAILLLAQTMARVSSRRSALKMLNLAFPLLDALTLNPTSTSFIETFTEVNLIKHRILQLRAWIYYRSGVLENAESDAKSCLELFPADALCSYVKTLTELCMGRFIDAIKSATVVLSRVEDEHWRNSTELIYLSYIKEWTRYLYWHLNEPISEFHWLIDLPGKFIEGWSNAAPLESFSPYLDEKGISTFASNPVVSTDYMKLILEADFPVYQYQPMIIIDDLLINNSFPDESSWRTLPDNPTIRWYNQPWFLQRSYLLNRIHYGCNIERILGESVCLGDCLNRRHRLALGISVLYNGELIRNFWCQRRHVTFSMCWSQAQNSGKFKRSLQFMKFPSPDERWINNSHICNKQKLSSQQFMPWLRRLCLSEKSCWPNWFIHTSLVAKLLQIADPYEQPTFWYDPHSLLYHQRRTNGAFEFNEKTMPHKSYSRSNPNHAEFETIDNEAENAKFGSYYTRNDNVDEIESGWRDAYVTEQVYLIKYGQLLPNRVPFAIQLIDLIYRSMEVQYVSDGSCDEDFSERKCLFNLLNSASSQNLFHYQSTSNHEQWTPILDKLWQNARQLNITKGDNQILLNINVPGTIMRTKSADLSNETSFDGNHISDKLNSVKHYLGAVLLFEKDTRSHTYSLSILRIVNPHYYRDLMAELDAAFENFLNNGEKALSTILAASNSKNENRRSRNLIQNSHLQNAINNTYTWLYYWSILKPINSPDSFLIGYNFVLSMLRALGLELTSITPKTQHLEFDSVTVGSPESFVHLCRKLMHLSWLSEASAALSLESAPDELIQTPKHFIEFSNLPFPPQCSVA